MTDRWTNVRRRILFLLSRDAADRWSARSDVARVAIVFVIVGVAIGVTTIGYLRLIGELDAVPDARTLTGTGIGPSVAGSALTALVLVGVAGAAAVGVRVAARARSKRDAAILGGVAGAVASLAVLIGGGIVLVAGVSVLGPRTGAAAIPSATAATTAPSPSPTTPSETETGAPRPGGNAPCEETFGADSPLCVGAAPLPSAPAAAPAVPQLGLPTSAGTATDALTFSNVLKLAVGILPALGVGALVASILYGRRPDGM
jgi:hypothetical protein